MVAKDKGIRPNPSSRLGEEISDVTLSPDYAQIAFDIKEEQEKSQATTEKQQARSIPSLLRKLLKR